MQTIWSMRDDFTFSYDARGRHDLKAGGELLRYRDYGHSCRRCMGAIDARNGPLPANIEALFPDAFNADTWNLAAISPIVRTYDVGVGDFFTDDTRPQIGVWLQDDWQLAPRLTLNLGVRYDLSLNASGKNYSVPPFVEAGKPDDTNNVQPRFGFAYHADRTDRPSRRLGAVFRGAAVSRDLLDGARGAEQRHPDHQRRPPELRRRSAQRPAAADAGAGAAALLPRPERARVPARNRPGARRSRRYTIDLARTWQSSLGVQRQIGKTMSVEADYVYSQGRNEKDIIDNVNLTFDPVTGANYPFSDIARRAFPEFGLISMQVRTGWSSYHALQTAWTKRLSNRWQASATYTLSGLWDVEAPPHSGLDQVPFPTAPDLGGEFTLGSTDLRHRAVFNGIWQVGRGFQVSGLFYTGHRRTGGDRVRRRPARARRRRRRAGAARQRLRPDGTIVPRNDFTQPRAPARGPARAAAYSARRPRVDRRHRRGVQRVQLAELDHHTDESSRQYLQRIAGRIARRSSGSA